MSAAALLNTLLASNLQIWTEGGALRYRAPKGAMTPQIVAELAANKHELIALLGKRKYARASFAQQRLWLLHELSPDSPFYNLMTAVTVTGPLEVAVLGQALDALVSRHEALRTTFEAIDGRPVQVVNPPEPVSVTVVDARGAAAPDAERRRAAAAEAQRGFDLARGPLLRATLVRLSDTESELLLVLHHIIADIWSIGVVVRELAALYAAHASSERSQIAELRFQFADFASEQAARHAERLGAQLAYWTAQLAGLPACLDLPVDRPRPDARGMLGARRSLTLSGEVIDQLKEFSQREAVTPFVTMLSAWTVLLRRYTGMTDIAVGSPIANRANSEAEQAVGFFSNTLVLRSDLSGDPSFRTLLHRTREVTLAAYERPDVPFAQVVEAMSPERSLRHNPLVQVMFDVLIHGPAMTVERAGVRWQVKDSDSWLAGYDLFFVIYEEAGRLTLSLGYATDIFDDATAERMLQHFSVVLREAMAAPDRRVSELPLVTTAERHALLAVSRPASEAPAADAFADAPLGELLRRQIAASPGRVAVRGAGQALSYAELDRRSAALADQLRSLGVGPGVRVALCCPASPELVVGLVAILRAGGGFVPVDADWSESYLAVALSRTGVAVVVALAAHADAVACAWHSPATIARAAVAQPGTPPLEILHKAAPPAAQSAPEPDDASLAYVLFDCGRAVLVDHAAARHGLSALQSAFGLTGADVVFHRAAPATASFGWKLLWPLLAGGCVAFAGGEPSPAGQRALAGEIAASGATIAVLSAADVAELAASRRSGERSLGALRRVVSDGSPFAPALCEAFAQSCDAELHGLYAPAESAGPVTWLRGQARPAPRTEALGAPLGARAYVLDDRRQLAPVGVFGQLHIAGDGLARGPGGDGPAGAGAFVELALPGVAAGRAFAASLRARWRADGTLELDRRQPRRAWIAGHWLELGDVESALRHGLRLDDCAVVPRTAATGITELVVYVVHAAPPALPQIRRALEAVLPPALLPTVVVAVASLPLADDGSVDTEALAGVEILDAAVCRRWDEALSRLPGVERAVTLVREVDGPLPRLHLSDLLPGFTARERRAAPAAGPERAAPAAGQTPAAAHGLSLCEGPPLARADALSTLPDMLRRAAADPRGTGVIYVQPDGAEVVQPYAALLGEAERVLGGLRQRGLAPGDRVILHLASAADFLPALWGCVLGGLLPIPLSPARGTAHDVAIARKLFQAWSALGPALVVTSADRHAEVVETLALDGPARARAATIAELRACEPDRRWHASGHDDVALVLLTSGSTGAPKGVQLSHRNILSSVAGVVQHNGFTSEDIALNWLALDHPGALIRCSMKEVFLAAWQVHAATEYVLEEPLRWLDLVERHRATFTWGPNFAFRVINDLADEVAQRRWDLSSLRFLLNTGEATVAATMCRFMEMLAPHGLLPGVLRAAWGMAETSSGVTFTGPIDMDAARRGALTEAGTPIPGIAIRIVDDQDRLVPEGTVGHLQVTGATVTRGYLPPANQDGARRDRTPEPASGDPFCSGAWFRTGDLGFVRGGQLTVSGRDKDIVILNGANHACQEIETAVEAVAGVETAYSAAFSVRDAGAGDTDALAIVFAPSDHADAALTRVLTQIRETVTRQFGSDPRYLIPVEKAAIPKTAIGKIQRAELRRRLVDGEFEAVEKRVDLLLGRNVLPAWFYRKVWRRQELPAERHGERHRAGVCLVLADRLGVGAAVCRELVARGRDVIRVERGPGFAQIGTDHVAIAPGDPDQLRRVIRGVADTGRRIDDVLSLWTYDDPRSEIVDAGVLEHAVGRAADPLFALVAALHDAAPATGAIRLVVAGSHTQPALPTDEVAYDRAVVLGLLHTLPRELPWLDCRHVDLPDDRSTDSADQNAARLVAELAASGGAREVAYRRGARLVPRLRQVDVRRRAGAPAWKHGGTYLISGGLGGIGAELAGYLAREFSARVLLVGRTPLDERPDEPPSDRLRSLRSLQRLPGAVAYAAVDVCDPEALRVAVDQALGAWQRPLDGVIHLAGAYAERPLVQETPASFAAVLRPKVVGAWALYQLIADRPDAVFISFSSLVTLAGGALVGAYAAANQVLEHFSSYLRHSLGRRAFCVAWSGWDGIGMSRRGNWRAALEARGHLAITAKDGLRSLSAGLTADEPVLLVGLDGNTRSLLGVTERSSLGTVELAAYCVLRDGAVLDDRGALDVRDRFGARTTCRRHLVDAIPVDSHGEVDVAALLVCGAAEAGDGQSAGLATEIERQVAAIWQELLGTAISRGSDHFFRLGGHSLLVARAISKIRDGFGIDLPFRALFEAPTVAGLSARIARLHHGRGQDDLPPLVPVPRDGALDMSFAQQRLWFLQRLEPESAAYHMLGAVRLHGPLDRAVLEDSLNDIVRRHEILRAGFSEIEGRPVLVLGDEHQIAVARVDLAGEPAERRAAALDQLARAEILRPFALDRAPLFRAIVAALGPDEHVLLLVAHHIVADGWSKQVFFGELAACYAARRRGAAPALPALSLQYIDFAAWQRAALASGMFSGQLAYWKQQLAHVPPLALAGGASAPDAQAPGLGGRALIEFPPPLVRALRELGDREGATLFMTLLAAFQTLLSRYTGQDDIAVGTPVANRTRSEIEGLIGFFANTLVLRTDLSGDPSFVELLGRVREVALGAYANQDFPFEKLVEELSPQRSLSVNPLFQVMFSVHQTPPDDLAAADLRLHLVDFDSETARFDLEFFLWERGEVLRGALIYRPDRFTPGAIERLLGHYGTLLEAIAAEPHRRISELALLTRSERRQLLVEWNPAPAPDAGGHRILDRFEAAVARAPQSLAAVFGEQALSYEQLNQRANRLAHLLARRGVGPDARVGLYLDRSFEMLVGLLGTLKAGAAYVPLDPAYPRERLAFMIADARVPVLVTRAAMLAEFPEHTAEVVCLDQLERDGLLDREPAHDPPRTKDTDPAVYVIYTSGSTGRPKGVVLGERALSNLITWQLEASGATGAGRTMQFTPLSFDVSFQEIFSTLCAGGTLVLISEQTRRDPAELLRVLGDARVERLFLPFVALQQLAEAAQDRQWRWLPSALREVVTAGEQLRITLPIAALFERLPACALHNHYGPTESHVVTSFTLSGPPRAWPALPPIGRPIPNAQAYVLDRNLAPVPVGVVGELYLGGVALARGYLDRPELTSQRFVAHPLTSDPAARLYRTGDLARVLPTGDIEFLGRADDQVKIRGFRVELEEISAVLDQHPAVKQCAVVAREDRPGQKELVAYVVAAAAAEPDLGELASYLRAKLPDFMVPGFFVVLDQLPLTPSGKVNRRALPAPERRTRATAQGRVAPATPTEDLVAGIWALVLELDAVGARDDFFQSGGHSLLATQVMSRVRDVFQVDLPLRTLFENPTVTALAAQIDRARSAIAAHDLPAMVRVPRDRPIPLSFAQQRLWFLNQIETGGAVYNMRSAIDLGGALDVGALERSLAWIIARHEMLRTCFPVVNGEATQVIHPARGARFEIPVVDLAGLPPAAREAEVARWVREEARRPFDLSTGPLIRATLLRLGAEQHVLLLSMHHIVGDGWSLGVLVHELRVSYEALRAPSRTPELAPLPIQYADYAVWQRTWFRGPVLEGQLAYWRDRLANLAVLELPTDRPRPAMQSFRGDIVRTTLSRELLRDLTTLSQNERCTLFMTLLAAFNVTLHRYTGQDDIAVGTPIANRTRAEVEGLIGFFVNTLVLRNDLGGDPSFRDLLVRVREVCLSAYAHQDLPFERLVEALQPSRDLSRQPLFQVMFVLQNTPLPELSLADLTLGLREVRSGTAKFDITLYLDESPDGMAVTVEYATDLFEAETIRRFVDAYQLVLAAVARDPSARVSQLPILSERERHRIVVEWNDTAADYHRERLLHEPFELMAASQPDATAVLFEDEVVTYRQLDEWSNRLANHLIAAGVARGEPVGIYLQRSTAMIPALLGVLKAGGVYVPFEPSLPLARVQWIAGSLAVQHVITQDALLDAAQQLADATPSLAHITCMDAGGQGAARAQAGATIWPASHLATLPVSRPVARATSDDLAYIIFTSGSTGTPKGVMVQHRPVINILEWVNRTFEVGPADRLLFVTSLSFDLSVYDVFGVLAAGGSIRIASGADIREPTRLVKLLCDDRITFWDSAPAALERLTSFFPAPGAGKDTAALRLVFLSGDWIPLTLPDRVRSVFNAAEVVSLGGATEATIWSNFFRFGPVKPEWVSIPYGRPIQNARYYILDAHLAPVPVGVPGDLYIGGECLAAGYSGQLELTSERFLPDPFSSDSRARLYKTGDRCRFFPDGNMEFLGRLDQQVKVRGFRVELGEIESVLRQEPAVRDAVVLAPKDAAGERSLVAYVAPDVDHWSSREATLWDDWQSGQVGHWNSVFEETYRELPEPGEPTFNIAGWTSRYTGQPIPAEEMREWVDATVARILALKPRRVLEIGCGTGLLLFRIAPHCECYTATDFSQVALDYVAGQLGALGLDQVSLLHRGADDCRDLSPASFDLVVINSVVQYFPSSFYLARVLEGAANLVAPGGAIFVGDVRSQPLQEAFAAAICLREAAPSETKAAIERRIWQAVSREAELVISPAFFVALGDAVPGIGHADIRLKRGRHHNELTKFRYDVTVHVDPRPAAAAACTWLEWRAGQSTIAELRDLLARGEPEVLGVKNVPNARLAAEMTFARVLAGAQGHAPVAELRDAIDGAAQHGAVDPEAFWQLADELPYDVDVSWSAAPAHGCFDVRLIRRSESRAAGRAAVAFPCEQAVDGLAWQDCTNNPLQSKFANRLVPMLRAHLGDRLPEYMVPSAFVVLDSLPLTSNGKVDRQGLPAPERARPESESGMVGPRDTTELTLVRIWQEVLDVSPIGVTDDFFQLGGHSVMSVRLMARIKEEFGQELPISTLLQGATIDHLAKLLRTKGGVAVPSPLVPIQREGSRAPFFCVHPAGGNVVCYLPLAQRLGGDRPFYGIQCPALFEESLVYRTVEELATGYVAALRRVQPEGPYWLGGWCVGAGIAFEMAQQLARDGETVAMLALFDGGAPAAAADDERLEDERMLSGFLTENGLTLPPEIARQANPAERLSFVLDHAKRLNLIPADVDARRARRLIEVHRNTALAVRRYRPERYADRVVLFRAQDEIPAGAPDPSMGWGRCTDVEVHDVPGNHFTMLQEPHVHVLARRLEACFDRSAEQRLSKVAGVGI